MNLTQQSTTFYRLVWPTNDNLSKYLMFYTSKEDNQMLFNCEYKQIHESIKALVQLDVQLWIRQFL